MKKLVSIIGVVILVLGIGSFALATPITFTDTTTFTETGTNPAEDYVDHGRGDVNKLEGTLDYVIWTHHFDFNPPAQEILTGTLTLYLTDDDPDSSLWTFEFALGWGEDGTWGFGEVDTGEYSYEIDVNYLEDGTFTVTLLSVWGDFYIDRSELTITYNPVPEPATLFLLGTGLIGLAGIGRKLKKS